MRRLPPRATLTATPFPYTALFRSLAVGGQDVRFVGDAPLHDAEGNSAFALPHGIGGTAGAQVDTDDARRRAGAVHRHIPDARSPPARPPDRRIFHGADEIGEAGFTRVHIYWDGAGDDGKIFVLSLGHNAHAHAYAAPCAAAPTAPNNR